LARRLNQSQQAASLHLVELEKENLIERRRNGTRLAVKITKKGQDTVQLYYAELRTALEEKPSEITIHGRLFEGLGEGAYYIGLPGYKKQFVKLLGFDPFPGTLNLKLTSPLDIEQKRRLRLGEGLTVKGFENGTRTYGGARCYRATISGKYPAAVLIIDRTHYDDGVLELISPLNLRRELGLKNDDDVEVRVLM
jgi:riboflavin kinase